MTFTFDSDTIQDNFLTFNIPNGPELALLRLYSQAANRTLNGATVSPATAWSSAAGLVMERVLTNDRFTRYKFKYATQCGIDDFDIIFTKDVAGVYNFQLLEFTNDFIWNLNQNLYNLEPNLWSSPANVVGQPLEKGLIKIKNVLPTEAPHKTRYISGNEANENYVFLTNNSI
jgi:hypothetical protein